MIKLLTTAAFVAAMLGASVPASADIKWNGITWNGITLQGISLQGARLNGVQFNGPGLVLQGLKVNGVQFNGPGIVFQGTAPNGTAMPAHSAGPVRERVDLTLAVHTVTLASGETIAVD